MHLPSYCILFKLNIFNDSRTFLSMGVTPIICLLFQNIGYSLSFVNINNTRKKSLIRSEFENSTDLNDTDQ